MNYMEKLLEKARKIKIDLGAERMAEYGTETRLICRDGKSRWCYCTRKCYYEVEIEIEPIKETKLKGQLKLF